MRARPVFLRSVLLAAAMAPGAVRAVDVPLRLDHEFLRRALVEQVYTGEGQTANVWDDGTGCNYLTLSAPKVDTRSGRLRVTSAGAARAGARIGDTCLAPIDWQVSIEVFEEAHVAPGAPVVRFRVVDSNLYDADGKKRSARGVLWDWVKQHVHPRLESVKIDLGEAANELRGVLPLLLARRDTERVRAVVDSLAVSEVRPEDTGLMAVLRFDVPPAASPPPAVPVAEPTLSLEELRRWETAWQQWDAFLAFAVKQAGADAQAGELRRALFDVLLEARHDLLEALAPAAPRARDPVRGLFLKSWVRLAPVLRDLAAGLPGEAALRYLAFVAAADALRALDDAAPDLGLDISADGLRRLARIVAPSAVEDPLAYSLEVDPQLRTLFGFGPPLPAPHENPDVDLGQWLVPAAWAALEPDQATVTRLNKWVPTTADIDVYLPLVRDLLRDTAYVTLEKGKLEEQFHTLYRHMLFATAWQESCWRQFVKEAGKIKPIRSPVGSVGLMQVNQNVWRGIYDVKGLQGDIAYNGRAGAEILIHYLADYAIAKGEHTKTGSTDNLARAAYAVYNGGPGHLRRYREKKTSKALRQIDALFWAKYEAVKAGRELAVAECYGKPGE